MSAYAKAVTAALTSVVGLAIAYGFITEAQAQQIAVIITATVNLVGVYLIPNR